MNGNWKKRPESTYIKEKRADAGTQYFTKFTILQSVNFWNFSLFRSACWLTRAV